MEVTDLRLKGLKLVRPKVFKDDRGFFLESFRPAFYEKLGLSGSFVQDNHSFSLYGCIRGMHFQSLPGQAKLVRVASGKIFDVAVDIRPDSSTYGEWEGVILDGESHAQLFIPVGFAHGFCVLSPEAHVLYKVSSQYCPDSEKGFLWNDKTINIEWPLDNPIVSERDRVAPSFDEIRKYAENGT